MFVSEDEARARLLDERNIFASKEPFEERAQNRPVEIVGDVEIVTEDEPDELFSLPTFDNLDDLDAIIEGSHRAVFGRARYKGKREAQKAIGEVETLLGPTSAGALFGTSAPQAYAYGEGLRSSNSDMGEIPGLKTHLNEVKISLALTASKRLRTVLKNLNTEKISAIADPMKLSSIGKDMAMIVDKMAPSDVSEFGAHLHIYAPTVNTVDQYQVVSSASRAIDARSAQE